jgi:hypothetical protein
MMVGKRGHGRIRDCSGRVFNTKYFNLRINLDEPPLTSLDKRTLYFWEFSPREVAINLHLFVHNRFALVKLTVFTLISIEKGFAIVYKAF